MAQGTVRWLNEVTGYGLVRPDDGRRDLFMRNSDAANGEAEPLKEGAEVNYGVKQGGYGMRATNVSRRRRYSCWDDSLERHEGKEARHAYYEGL